MLHAYHKVLVLLCLSLTTLATASIRAAHPLFENNTSLSQEDDQCITISYQDVPYGSHPQQVYDIYFPTVVGDAPAKVLILVHGGSWVSGDKSRIRNLVNRIRNKYPEYAIVNTNYRLATETQYAFPDQFNDIGLLIEHLTSISDSYEITPEFGLIGKSAGGHLSLMYDALYDESNQVKFVCNLAGPTNFNDPAFVEHPMYEEVYNLLVDPAYYHPDTALEILSPIYHIGYYNSPTLIFHGNKDRIVPVSNAEDYSEKLKRNAIDTKLTLFAGTHLRDWTPQDWLNVENKIGDYLLNFLPLVD
ncbi:MAG: alpha/beta hydrolase [Gilvibacter sp.]